jgi:hypothetical protein
MPDEAEGKKVRCAQCREVFVGQPDVVDVDPIDEPPPRPGIRTTPRTAGARPIRAEAPRSRSAPAYENQRPRSMARPTPRNGSSPEEPPSRQGLYIAIGIGSACFLVLCIVGVIILVNVLNPSSEENTGNQAANNNRPNPNQPDNLPKQPDPLIRQPDNLPRQPELPKDPPKPAVEPALKYAHRLPLDCMEHEVREIFFSNQDAGIAAVYSHIKSTTHRLDRYDLKTGKKLNDFEIKNPFLIGERKSLSPDGTRFAYEDAENWVVVVDATSGEVLWRFLPYSIKGRPDLVGAIGFETMLARFEMLDNDRVLTINQAGGMDLWKIKPFQRLAGCRPLVPGPTFQRRVWGLALTPDRKMLAVFIKDGFALFDTSTCKAVARTATIADRGTAFNCWGVAFNADGTKLAAAIDLAAPGAGFGQQKTYHFGWDLKTNKVLFQFPQVATGRTLRSPDVAWWGNDDLLIWDAGAWHQLDVVGTNGKTMRRLELNNHGARLTMESPDGRFWYSSAAGIGGMPFLVAVPRDIAPLTGGNGTEKYPLTIDGVVKGR